MWKNYLISALRFLKRNKSYSILNLTGLAIGISCSIFIFLWILDELSYDECYRNNKDIYRLVYSEELKSGIFKSAATPAPYAPAFKEIIPEIIDYFRVKPVRRGTSISYDNTRFLEKDLLYADPAILNILDFEFLHGNNHSLDEPNNVILTEKAAQRYFIDEDPIGKIILLDNITPLKVTGIIKNVHQNSHLQFDFLLNFRQLELNGWKTGWYNRYYYTYFLLGKNSNIEEINQKLCENLAMFMNSEHNMDITADLLPDLYLQPLTDIHLKSDFQIDLYGASHKKMQYVYFFSIIGILILIICSLNYTNLSIAYYSNRKKETILRKLLGASRKQLIYKSILEAIIFSIFAYILAYLLFESFIDKFNSLTGKELYFDFTNPRIIGSAVITILFTGLLSGLYPAVYISSFHYDKTSDDKRKRKATTLRKALVITQFATGVMLITGTLIVKRQMTFIHNKNLGLEKSNIIYLNTTGSLLNKFQVFKQELEKLNEIKSVTYASALPTHTVHSSEAYWGDGQNKIVITQEYIEADYLNAMNIQLKAGRSFDKTSHSDSSNYIINEAAAKIMGMDDPIGEKFEISGKKGYIIGVMNDFNFKSLHHQIEPLVYHVKDRTGPYIFIKIKGKNISREIETIKKAYDEINPGFPFEYHILKNEFSNLYKTELKTGQLFAIFSLIAIFLALLGFFGLASYMARIKSKEIAIRKTFGATSDLIVKKLTWSFTQWILLANIIAIPVSYYIMENWLDKFAFRIQISWMDFIFPLIFSVIVALSAQLFQILKAAKRNPVDSLRYE